MVVATRRIPSEQALAESAQLFGGVGDNNVDVPFT
jgi:hypothetical protein